MENLYEMIFKRKSVRKYDDSLSLTEDELELIRQKITELIPLDQTIRVRFRIVRRSVTTAKFGEYCLLIYSEQKLHYMLNAGYMLEQMDLFLESRNIGACWCGMAMPEEKEFDGLDYVIMLVFGKSRPEDFRQSVSEFNRKNLDEIWTGDFNHIVKEAVRLAPSACNTQPWRFTSSGPNLNVFRNTVIPAFIPVTKLPFFNTIDMGICLLILETALDKQGYRFERVLPDEKTDASGLLKIATYIIK